MLEILAQNCNSLSIFFSDLRSFILESKTLHKRENNGSLKKFILALPLLHKCCCTPAKMCFKVEPGYGFPSWRHILTTNTLNQELISSVDILQSCGGASTLFSALCIRFTCHSIHKSTLQSVCCLVLTSTLFFLLSLSSILSYRFCKTALWSSFILCCSSEFEVLPDSYMSDASNNSSSMFGEILCVCSINIVDRD